MDSYYRLLSYQQRSLRETALVRAGLVNGAAISLVLWAALAWALFLVLS